MGTQFRIVLYSTDPQSGRAAADAALDRIDQLEDILSDYQADSELSLLREHSPGTPVKVSQDLFEVLWLSQKLSLATLGAFDVTMGPFTRLWRFSRKRGTLPSATDVAQARREVGFEKLELDKSNRTVTMTVPGMRLDVGGIAKGYSADQALKKLKSMGFDRVLVAASGDIAFGNPPPGKKGWTVAIARPGQGDTPLGDTLTLHNAGISTSGDTEQFIVIDGVRYSHILDPWTGLGLTNQVQATVVAPCASLSDPLATALRILGPQRGFKALKNFPGTEALVTTYDHEKTEITQTKGFKKYTNSR